MNNVLELLLNAFGVQRTEAFFQEHHKTREALKRFSNSHIHTLDGTSEDLATYLQERHFAQYELVRFRSAKRSITLLPPGGRWCYVPDEICRYMKEVQEVDRFYSQFYVNCDGSPVSD